MRKILALYHNEMLKISRKVSILVLLILMVISVFGFGGIFKLESYLSAQNSQRFDDSGWIFPHMKEELSTRKAEYADLERRLAQSQDPDEQMALQEQMDILGPEIQVTELALEKKIPYQYDDGGVPGQALEQLRTFLYQQRQWERQYAMDPTPENQKKAESYKDLADRMRKVVDSADYQEYIAIDNDFIRLDDSMTEEEKAISLESNRLRLKCDPKGENVSRYSYGVGLEGIIDQIESGKRSLLYNLDYSSRTSNKPLSAEKRQEVENQLAANVYRLEHGMYTKSTNGYTDMSASAVSGMISIGVIVIVLMIMILAGGSVSQEMSTGSIKSLIIAPVKRWKIFTAKLMALTTVGILATLLMYGAVLLANLIFFGTSLNTPYVYAVNGVAHELNFFVYQLAYVFVNYIDVFVYMVLAFMLSIVTRNSAASVGISIGLYFGGNILMQILIMVASGEWVKFVPFNNLSLAGKFFPYASDALMLNAGMDVTAGVTGSLSFSLIYLAVMVFCMGYIAFDSFTRRDIK